MMKTRTIEIPVCDLCSRDGEVYRVSPEFPTAKASFAIVRCARHIERLERDGSEEQAEKEPPSKNNHTPIPELAEQLYQEVVKEPGLSPREYGERLGVTSRDQINRSASRLKSQGRLQSKGSTVATRYYTRPQKAKKGA